MDVKVPKTKPSPYMKCWWLQGLTDSCQEVHRLMQQAYKRRADASHLIHYAHKMKRNLYREMIEHTKRRHWENFLETINEKQCGLHTSMCLVSPQMVERCGSLPWS